MVTTKVGWQDLASKITGHPVKIEFPKNNAKKCSISMSQVKLQTYTKNLTEHPIFYLATLAEVHTQFFSCFSNTALLQGR